jgi:hypothetical protein
MMDHMMDGMGWSTGVGGITPNRAFDPDQGRRTDLS